MVKASHLVSMKCKLMFAVRAVIQRYITKNVALKEELVLRVERKQVST